MRTLWKLLTFLTICLSQSFVTGFGRGYDGKYVNANIPEWKQRACEKSFNNNRSNAHYICDEKGDVKCLPGWQGDLCQVPMCRKGCDPMNGYCQRPGECRCRIGYTGELCSKCIPLPGCQHGYCTKPFECLCQPGWDGLFCTEPTCRQGCHSTRGYCESPHECRCRIGWTGRNCSECAVMPGCQHGVCQKPLECQCLSGYTGLLCQTPICATDCHKQHGYCRKPGECRCKVGWMGTKCDQCFPYPGCVHGSCERPWECNCKPGWGGMLCDEQLTYCANHSNACENGGTCISLTQADGNFRCQCRQGYLGKQCEIVDEYLLTSTAAPRITPPPPPSIYSMESVGGEDDDDEEKSFSLTTKDNNTNTVGLSTIGNSEVVSGAAAVNLKINEVQNANIDHDLLTKGKIATTSTSTSKTLVVEGNAIELKNQTVENKLHAQNITLDVNATRQYIPMDLVAVSKKNTTILLVNSTQTKVEQVTAEIADNNDNDDDEYEYEEEDEEYEDDDDSAENET